MFSNCAALLLLFPVWRSASKICSFSVSSLRSAILVLFDAGVSKSSVPNSNKVMKLLCANKVALLTITQ